MATFEAAIPVVLEHEGGIADIGDGEGVTAFGWTQATCKALGIEQPKTKEEATELYRQHFWMPIYDRIASQNVATKVFDDAVNQGHGAAHRMLQRALCATGSIVVVDGIFGPATLAATNMVPEEMLLPWMRKFQYSSYCNYIDAKPKERTKLERGLARRAAWPDENGVFAMQLLNGMYPLPTGVKNAENA
jgi:lysozyme family protein